MTEVNMSEQPHVDHSYNPSGLRGLSMESFKLLEESDARLYVPSFTVNNPPGFNVPLESRKESAGAGDEVLNQTHPPVETLERLDVRQ